MRGASRFLWAFTAVSKGCDPKLNAKQGCALRDENVIPLIGDVSVDYMRRGSACSNTIESGLISGASAWLEGRQDRTSSW